MIPGMGGEEPRLLGVLILRGLLLLRLLLLVLGEVRGQVEAALAAEDGEGELELEGGKHSVEELLPAQEGNITGNQRFS